MEPERIEISVKFNENNYFSQSFPYTPERKDFINSFCRLIVEKGSENYDDLHFTINKQRARISKLESAILFNDRAQKSLVESLKKSEKEGK